MSNTHDIVSMDDGRKTVHLDGGRNLVAGQIDVATHDRVKASLVKIVERRNASFALLENLDFGEPVIKMRKGG